MTTTTRPHSRHIAVNDLRLHYLDWGEPHPGAPVVLCTHGFATSAHTFNGFARRFRDRFHILSMDMRGHGDSDHAHPDFYADANHVTDLEGVLDTLKIDRAILIGSSLGGRSSMQYAAMHPERVDRLVVNDVGVMMKPNPNRRPPDLKRPREFVKPEDALPYLHQAMPPYANLTADEQMEQALGLLRQRDDGVWVWKLDMEPIRQRRSGRLPPLADLSAMLQQIVCPTLIVWGVHSHVLDEEQARHMAQALPQGELAVVPGVGHTPWLTEPEAVAALERFLGASPLLTQASP